MMSLVAKTKTFQPKPSRPHMPNYGVPASSKGLLPWKWAEQRLKKSHNYFISTAKPDGSPHTMVIWGLWQDGAFYFSTGAQSRKGKNLAKNPHCVICSENAAEAVVVEGIAEVVKDRTALKWFSPAYKRKYDWDMDNFAEPVYIVRPRVAFGLYEEKFQQSATRWKFRS